jgi:hypothetical protein
MTASITKCDLRKCKVRSAADGTKTAEQEWIIQTSEPTGVIFAQGNAHAFNSNFPDAGQSFYDGWDTYDYLQAFSLDTEYVDAPKCKTVFRCVAQFLTPTDQPITRDPTAGLGNPLAEPPLITFSVAKTKQAVYKDLLFNAIASSAGEPYNPVQERDRTIFSIHIERNMATDNSISNADYKDTVNKNTFWGHGAHKVKCEIPGLVQRQYTPRGLKYFRETWEFSFDSQTYDLKLIDWGYKKLNGSGGVETIMGANGEYLTAPTFLNLAGGVSTTAQTLPPFYIYAERDFSLLGLPTSM